MATMHKGSPPNDPSSAPESGTVREGAQSVESPQNKKPVKPEKGQSQERRSEHKGQERS